MHPFTTPIVLAAIISAWVLWGLSGLLGAGALGALALWLVLAGRQRP